MPPSAPPEGEPEPADQDAPDSEPEAGTGEEEDPEPELPLRRARPATTAAELEWIEEQIQHDPFLQPREAIGPAPETREFYDPFAYLKLGTAALRPQVCRYMVQNRQGEVVGQLVLRITAEDSPLYGPVFHITQNSSLGYGEQVEVWQSALSGKPLRVTRARDFGTRLANAAGVQVKDIERFDARYQFDRVNVVKTKGGVTLAVPSRIQYSCFDVAQLPILLQLLDYRSADWPFEAALFDSTTLELLPLQVGRPARKTVQSAEPATRECWEIPVRWADQQLTWYVERAAPQRLVKFSFSSLTFTLQDFVELKAS